SLAATLTPMASFFIGIQMNFKRISHALTALYTAVFVKLLVAQTACLLLVYLLGLHGNVFRVSVYQMTIACLFDSCHVLEKFGLNVKFANTLIGVSIVVGILLSFAWYSVINTLL